MKQSSYLFHGIQIANRVIFFLSWLYRNVIGNLDVHDLLTDRVVRRIVAVQWALCPSILTSRRHESTPTQSLIASLIINMLSATATLTFVVICRIGFEHLDVVCFGRLRYFVVLSLVMGFDDVRAVEILL